HHCWTSKRNIPTPINRASRIPTTNEITQCRLALTSFDPAPFCAAPIPNQKDASIKKALTDSAPLRDRFGENGEMRPEIDADFNCDRLPKYYLGGHFSQEHTTKDVTLNFEVGFSNNRERHLHSDELVIRYNFRTRKLWINGNQCKWDK